MLAALQLDALGDGTRRRMVEILSTRPRSVAELAGRLPVSRPAVSQHLRVLRAAGLVARRSEGTRNIYRLDPNGVAALRDHLDMLLQTALDQMAATAERTSSVHDDRLADGSDE